MQTRSCQQLASTETMPLLVYQTEPLSSQLRQTCCPNLSCDQFSQSYLAGGKRAP